MWLLSDEVMDMGEAAWQRRFSELSEIKAKPPKLAYVPHTHPNAGLRDWLAHQKALRVLGARRANAASATRKERMLEALPTRRSSPRPPCNEARIESVWRSGCLGGATRRRATARGVCCAVQPRPKPGCRTACVLAGLLDAGRERALSELGVDWTIERRQHERNWDANLTRLLAFRRRHGHTMVHQRLGALGPWLSRQRLLWRKGQLPPMRVAQLSALGVDISYTTDFNCQPTP
jgi:Helicase associated domain